MTSGGYFDGGEYESFGFYRSLTPTQMRFMAALQGMAAPELTKPFRYCELGCGQAMTLLLNAAMFPNGEFVGVDFSPTAIARAEALAERMGLTNLHLICSDFAAFHESAPGPFDFIVSHGVWTWVGPQTQASMQGLLRDALAPGGVACISANIVFGWHKVLPIQHYLLCAAAAAAPDDRPELAQKLLSGLASEPGKTSGRASSVAAILRQAPSYFSHEYLAPAWKPITLLELIAAAENAGVSWLGPGQPRHGLEPLWASPFVTASIPPGVPRAARHSAMDALMETGFRTELFGRGNAVLSEDGKHDLLTQLHLTVTHATPVGNAVHNIFTALDCVDQTFEEAMLARMKIGGFDGVELLDLPTEGDITPQLALNIVCGLLAAGLCDLTLAGALSPTQNRMIAVLNEARIAFAEAGFKISALASPRTAAIVSVDSIDLAHLIASHTGEAVVERAGALLRRAEARALVNGAPPPDAEAAFDRMVQRACGIWPQTGAKRLAALGIEVNSAP
jgi:SAM-dependent methyltransferase